MRAADSEAILTGMDRARELAQAGLIHSLEMAMAELTGEDKWQAMNFLERVAERVIVGYGSVGPGGKVVAAAPGEEPGALVKIYLPSNDRPANPSPANDSIEIDVSKFPSAD